MTRILADLPEDDLKWLDQLAAEYGTSRDSLLSEVVRWHAAKLSSEKCAS